MSIQRSERVELDLFHWIDSISTPKLNNPVPFAIASQTEFNLLFDLSLYKVWLSFNIVRLDNFWKDKNNIECIFLCTNGHRCDWWAWFTYNFFFSSILSLISRPCSCGPKSNYLRKQVYWCIIIYTIHCIWEERVIVKSLRWSWCQGSYRMLLKQVLK